MRDRVPARWSVRLTVVLLGVAALALTLWVSRPPSAMPADAPADRFSASRAVQHLTTIAEGPRPTGTQAHARTRQYLVDTLTALGIETRVHTGAAVSLLGPAQLGGEARYAGAQLQTVIGRVPGTASTRPVALVTHYDSVAAGPGANDAGVPTSALLETARAVMAGPRPRNDLLFVFTDAEEIGLLGAKALVEDPEGLPDAALVLNFEARGSSGPTLMFETGTDSAWLVDLLARHSVRPQTSSLFAEAYRYLPNLTDFTVFAAAGHQGMNFAYLEGYTHYHGPHDTVANVDPATVQHQGEYALGLAKALGTADLTAPPAGDSVHFTALWWVVSYPEPWALPLALVVTLVCAAALVAARRRGELSVRRVAGGALVAVAHPIVVGAAVWLTAPLVATRHPETADYGDIPANWLALAAFALLTLALSACMALLLRRWVDLRHQAFGAIVVWAVAASVTAALLPGVSYVFTWPALGALAAWWLTRREPGPAAQIAAAALALVPVVVIVVPLVVQLSTALGVVLIAVAAAVLALGLTLLPLIGTMLAPRLPRGVPALAMSAALVIGVVASIPTGQAPAHRAVASYFLDATSGTAALLSTEQGGVPSADERPAVASDLWPAWSAQLQRAPAAALPLPPPTAAVQVLSQGRVHITAASARGATELALVVTGARVLSYRVQGAESGELSLASDGPREDAWELWVWCVPPEGVVVELEVEPGEGEPVLRVADRTGGLPGEVAGQFRTTTAPAVGETLLDNATFVSARQPLREIGKPGGDR
ncbi:M28 family peptidase [Lentzea sp. DG1S-22]|uniref:M28 family peptidase n=1 Tax=Lentzea sp. DG1S-22 TaxID=3108822 RepID=UPI002E7720C7|nr:M28 family peptidase [Lentzea sp. DG1S-22]WVH82091.1 M28 family peptidase [Lentzea sp. DG1S-22]